MHILLFLHKWDILSSCGTLFTWCMPNHKPYLWPITLYYHGIQIQIIWEIQTYVS